MVVLRKIAIQNYRILEKRSIVSRISFRFPCSVNWSLLHAIQTGSGAYAMGTGGSFPGGKVAGAWGLPLTSS
jgi:hypothetical protein